MRTLSIDIETYSSVSLQESGVYAYSEAPDFSILLFAYAFDEEEVQIIDLAQGDVFTAELLEALTSNEVNKTAYNANFERTCLAKYLEIPMPPHQWRCTAVHASVLGLPGNLSGVCSALGFNEDQAKSRTGKALIQYFSIPCKPTTKNGNRTRNLPEHDIEKWQLFKEYCKQDVVAERAIKAKLSMFPLTQSEQELWELDQKINDTGILIDLLMVENIITYDEQYQGQLLEEAKQLTGLSNPNSVAQLKNWLRDQGINPTGLDKEKVTELIQTTEGTVKRVLELRQAMSKTSVKKYEAMKRGACRDQRVRGCFQFYGANRSGRWCLTGDHEILTERGWERLDEWRGGKIACWNPTGEMVSFQDAKALSFSYKGELYEYDDTRISQLSTPDHQMYVKKRYEGEWTVDTVSNMAHYRPSIPFTGYRRTNSGMEHQFLRVLIMIQADGSYTNEGNIKLSFIKERKVARCKMLLRAADISYTLRTYEEKGRSRYVFTIYARHVPMYLRMFQNKTFGTWIFDESADVFFDELVHWDGYRSAPNSIQYSTCNKQNADIIQAFAHLTGRSALIKKKVRNNPKWNDAYVVDIWLTPKNCHEVRNKPQIIDFCGLVYCAETQTGYFLVRRNGKVWVTGNSGRQVQLQNLPQNKIPDINLARELVIRNEFEKLELLFGETPFVLSQLVRTAFIPSKGNQFIVSDFSAIEARVIAWLAREQWRLDVFNLHGKIYEASASKMFKVPIESIGKGSPLRQKGKVAELACGYQGGVGALKAMGAEEMGLSDGELQVLISDWREANPHIVQLWSICERAAKEAIESGWPQDIGKGIIFSYDKGYLFIQLPSGRKLAYYDVAIQGKQITYMGIEQQSKRWSRLNTYGGKLVENIVQAIARDCLAEAMKRVNQAGYRIVMHVHDEVILDTDKGSIDDVTQIMSEDIEWAPGLPLKGDTYSCSFYRKD